MKHTWTPADSSALYNVANWGEPFFRVADNGHVVVRAGTEDESAEVDLFELTNQVLRRGVVPPILFRFDGILRSRVKALKEAFDNARAEYEYEAPYRSIYPIKVNQERHVVDALLAEGRSHGLGLEAGSKPELLAVITLKGDDELLVICNGYKDTEYVEMALLASKIGIRPILVIEKLTELDTILDAAARLGVDPVVGVRTKLSFRGSGRWQDSVGSRSKFGLTTREIMTVVERLRDADKLHCLQLLHFHLGSQITQIRTLKKAMGEGIQLLAGLTELGVNIRWFDVGGGLGVDYDGSKTNFESSMNYSLQEYANDIVSHLRDACEDKGIAQPAILSESGRALTAHHSVLITEVLGTSDPTERGAPAAPEEDEADILRSLADVCEAVTEKTYQEAYHDAVQLREEASMLFNVGHLSLSDRARVDEFYFWTCYKILRITRELDYVPDDLSSLERELASTYFLNFSLFQSVPDSWAIRQLFPILPIHRLDEEPTERATVADITCDSDGKVDRFIDLRDVKSTLELHKLQPGAPYYLGIFLVGAYQEILGDMHNLFGDTHVVHVDLDATGRPRLANVTRGDRVMDVLSYVDYEEPDLLRDLRRNIEQALDDGRLSYEESALIWRRYEDGLRGYTYLTRNSTGTPLPDPDPADKKSTKAPARNR